MTDETDTPRADRAGGRTGRFLDRWRDRWRNTDGGRVVGSGPTSQVHRIDWTLVQDVRGETHAGRV